MAEQPDSQLPPKMASLTLQRLDPADYAFWTTQELCMWMTEPQLQNGGSRPPILSAESDKLAFQRLEITSYAMFADISMRIEDWIGEGLSLGAARALEKEKDFLRSYGGKGRNKRAAEDEARLLGTVTKRREYGLLSALEGQITDFWKRISQMGQNVEELSNPSITTELPFPLMYEAFPTKSFSINMSGYFRYTGREVFDTLYSSLISLRPGSQWYIPAPFGTGKSYVLAACTVLLLKQGYRVVYIPDCEALQVAPAQQIAMALLPLLYDHERLGTKIWEVMEGHGERWKMEKLYWICNRAQLFGVHLVFVLDGAEALKEFGPGRSARESEVLIWLDRIMSDHGALKSLRPSWELLRGLEHRSYTVLEMGGYNAEECEGFWRRYESLKGRRILTRPQKEMVEHLTGGLPLLLDSWENLQDDAQATKQAQVTFESPITTLSTQAFNALISAFLDSELVGHMRSELADFHARHIRHEPSLPDYLDVLRACVHRQRVSPPQFRDPDPFIDHRFFTLVTPTLQSPYISATSGIAQLIAADLLQDSLKLFPRDCLPWIITPRNDAAMHFIVTGLVVSQFEESGIPHAVRALLDPTKKFPQLARRMALRRVRTFPYDLPLLRDAGAEIYVLSRLHGMIAAGLDFVIVARKERRGRMEGVVVGCKVVVGKRQENDESGLVALKEQLVKWMQVDELSLTLLRISEHEELESESQTGNLQVEGGCIDTEMSQQQELGGRADLGGSSQGDGSCVHAEITFETVDKSLSQWVQVWREYMYGALRAGK